MEQQYGMREEQLEPLMVRLYELFREAETNSEQKASFEKYSRQKCIFLLF